MTYHVVIIIDGVEFAHECKGLGQAAFIREHAKKNGHKAYLRNIRGEVA